jgi:hypothetical protein
MMASRNLGLGAVPSVVISRIGTLVSDSNIRIPFQQRRLRMLES